MAAVCLLSIHLAAGRSHYTIASHYSSTAMKVFGRNNVAILVTLFLLSYTKIFKTIITVLNFTEVLQGSADNVSDQLVPYKVWILCMMETLST